MNDKGIFKKGFTLAVLSAVLWGLFGPFLRLMAENGISDITVTTLAPTIMFLFFGGWILIKDRSMFKVSWKVLIVLMIHGFVLMNGMNFAYVQAVSRIPVGIVSLLAFCNVIILMIMERIFKGIKLTKVKIIACSIAVVGVALVLQIFNLGTSSLDIMGIIWALANSLILASAYFLISHVYYPNDESWQAQLFYPNLFGALFLYVTACPPWQMISDIAGAAAQNGAIVWIIVLGFAALPQVLSFSWIQMAFGMIDAPYVSMAYCLEPVVALIVGFFMFGESMTMVQIIGIVLTIVCIFYTYYAESKEPLTEN